jgi:hypothetical protein
MAIGTTWQTCHRIQPTPDQHKSKKKDALVKAGLNSATNPNPPDP